MSRRSLLALVALLVLSGCERASFRALTTPPPDREASLDGSDPDSPSIRLSRGVALAFECTYKSKPCEDASAHADDSGRIQVMRTHVDRLVDDGYAYSSGQAPVSSFVVIGSAAGQATLTVEVDGRGYDIQVAVLDP